jgi:membrane-associated HD superfamily phosphohydrolase
MDGVNPHDRLDPYSSADIIRGHVTDGLDLARRYKLPGRIRAFISEHHGDAFVSFMYQRAVEEAGGDATKVDETRFRYGGPKPRSRETALVMLADGTEAISKSKGPSSVEDLDELVRRAIKLRVEQGQLDDSDLTLRELELIRQSFVDTLKGLFHTRIEYPGPSPAEVPATEPGKEAPGLAVAGEKAAAASAGASFVEAFPPPEKRKRRRRATVREAAPDRD